ncbi:phage regulatory protein, partial [Enterococcus faecalis]|nr:phage regulatory protein [Enterococcus faecalis]
KRDRLNNLDVINENKRLKEIYIAVVKEFAIKYGIWK